MERTVKDVVPALQTNQDGLKKVLDDLVKNYKTKQDELDSWKVRGLQIPITRDKDRSDADFGYRRRTMSKLCSNKVAIKT